MDFKRFSFVILFATATLAYHPDTQNVYHLFTRMNPTVSQPMLLGSSRALAESNYNPRLKTVLLIHGWLGSAKSEVNTVLVPAYLRADDINVFVVDWSRGSNLLAGDQGPVNAVISGKSVARFIDWLVDFSMVSMDNIILVGHSLGGHQAAVVGRSVTRGRIPYIVALDPGNNMEDSGHIFSTDAAVYTEAIHTNSLVMGHGFPLAHVDFYPNGGHTMPGCGVNIVCSHLRSIYYFAETLSAPQRFQGTSCLSFLQATVGLCFGSTLPMGGLLPKTGASGIFHLETNAEPPFSTLAM